MNKEKNLEFERWWAIFLTKQIYPENYANSRDKEMARHFYNKGTLYTKEVKE